MFERTKNALGRWMRDLFMPLALKHRGDTSQWIYQYSIDWDKRTA